MPAGIKANPDGSAAIQVGGTDVITLTSGGAATFVTSPTTVQAGTAAAPSITTSGDTNTGIFFPAADTIAFAEGGAEALRINSSGTVVLSGGDTSANGTGITFPATQSASSNANTLDDYEEGTWTPAVSFAGGTTGITYSEQLGKYTKIGRVVYAEAEIALTSKGSSTGRFQIDGLPFVGLGNQFSGSVEIRFVTFTQKYAIVETGRSGNYFRLMFIDSAANSTEATNTNIANNSVFLLSAFYFV